MKGLVFGTIAFITTSFCYGNEWYNSIPAHNYDKKCMEYNVKKDVFFLPAVDSRGDCIKYNDALRPVISTLTNKALKEFNIIKQPKFKYVANVLHDYEPYIAEIPLDRISNVYYQMERKWIAVIREHDHHVQLRINFSDPIKLTSIWDKHKIEYVDHIVLMQASIGDKKKNEMASYNIHTMNQRFSQNTINNTYYPHMRTRQFLLEIPNASIVSLLEDFLSWSNTRQLGFKYDMVKENCVTTIIDLIRMQPDTFSTGREFLPFKSLELLKDKGLINDELQNYEVEFDSIWQKYHGMVKQ